MNNNTANILDYYGKTHASYLHANGKRATQQLINLLNPCPNERILEIGFGTGATLVTLASSYKHTKFFGYELSQNMFQIATRRIAFCFLKNTIKLVLLSQKNKFPDAENTFDKIYIESVLGIQEKEDFKSMLLEIKRVLKPNGVLIFNETIWLDSTPIKVINKINSSCKKTFGIIQANEEYPYLRNWKNILEELNFNTIKVIPQNHLEKTQLPTVTSTSLLLSNIFTAKGKLLAFISPSLKERNKFIKKNINLIMKDYNAVMQGVLVKSVLEK